AAAIVLAFAAFTQGDEPVFPYKVNKLQTPVAVRAFILAHPGNSRAHLLLLKLAGQKLTPDVLDGEAQRALWLEPINPLARDIHARVLFARNQGSAALQEIGRSVFFSPDPATHFYLAPDRIAGLSPRERDAVERGFQKAVAWHFPDAVS